MVTHGSIERPRMYDKILHFWTEFNSMILQHIFLIEDDKM